MQLTIGIYYYGFAPRQQVKAPWRDSEKKEWNHVRHHRRACFAQYFAMKSLQYSLFKFALMSELKHLLPAVDRYRFP